MRQPEDDTLLESAFAPVAHPRPLGQESAADRARRVTAQFHSMLRLLPGVSLHSVSVLLPLVWLTRDMPWTAMRTTLYGLVFGIAVFYMTLWWRWGRGSRVPVPKAWRVLCTAMCALEFAVSAVILLQLLPQLQETGRLVAMLAATSGWVGRALGFASYPPMGRAVILGGGPLFFVGAYLLDWEPGPAMAVLSAAIAVATALAMRGLSIRFLNMLRAEDEIAGQRATLSGLLHDFEQHADDWLWELDCDGHLLRIAPQFARQIGVLPESLVGLHVEQVLELVRGPVAVPAADAGAHTQGLAAQFRQLFAQPRPFDTVLPPWPVRGHLQWWRVKGIPVFDRDGQWLGWRGVTRDVTAAQEAKAQLEHLALHDSLTGLLNRHAFRELLVQRLQALANADALALLLIDIDNFKAVNDSLGHPAGNEALVAVGQRLAGVLPADATLARLGGDEFAVLLTLPAAADPEHREHPADTLAEALRHAVTQPLHVQERVLDLRISQGLALAPADAQTTQDLMRAADLALFAAKQRGRGQCVRFVPQLERQAREDRELIAALRGALDHGALDVAYQPKWDMQTARLLGFEALARWTDPTFGPVSPARFIPLAESAGLIDALSALVLRQACSEAARWPAGLSLAINVSALQIAQPHFAQGLLSALQDAGLPPQRLEIELTESVLLSQPDSVIEQMQQLRRAGVRLALDDFGTGFSSLAYLHRLPLDVLKIDRSFVLALRESGEADGRGNAIARSIVQLAQAIGAVTVAEGVETVEQQQALAALGCHIGQGFLVSPPLSAAQALAFIGTQAAQA